MKKQIIIYIYLLVIAQYSFSRNVIQGPLLLNSLLSANFFKLKNEKDKEMLNQQLINNRDFAAQLKFEGVTLKDIDLSGMYLRNINFSGCKFVKVNLQNADLTDTQLDRTIFDKASDLSGAIIYYPLDDKKKPMMDKALRINDWRNHRTLIKQYSDLMLEARENKYKNIDVVLEKAGQLNKILSTLSLHLSGSNLSGFDLTNMNLTNVGLYKANLQRVWLSKNVQVSEDYTPADLLDRWGNGNPEEQECYQKLFNAGVDFKTEADPIRLRETLEKKIREGKSLKGANLVGVNLQGFDLTNMSLTNIVLYKANLQRVWLSKNVQVSEDYTPSDLFDKWSNGSPEEQEYYQILFNTSVDFITGVDTAKLRRALEKKTRDGISLKHSFLKNVDLKGTDLRNADLQGSILWNANLQKTRLQGSDLRFTYLKGARLSENFYLPLFCKDEDLIDIYEQCKDLEAKQQLKDIILGKQLKEESYFVGR